MTKRKNTRINIDEEKVIKLYPGDPEKELIGVLNNKSIHGLCAVFCNPFPYKENDIVKIGIGNISEIDGTIKWTKDIGDDFTKVGIGV